MVKMSNIEIHFTVCCQSEYKLQVHKVTIEIQWKNTTRSKRQKYNMAKRRNKEINHHIVLPFITCKAVNLSVQDCTAVALIVEDYLWTFWWSMSWCNLWFCTVVNNLTELWSLPYQINAPDKAFPLLSKVFLSDLWWWWALATWRKNPLVGSRNIQRVFLSFVSASFWLNLLWLKCVGNILCFGLH